MAEEKVQIVGAEPPPEPPKGRYVRILTATQKHPAVLIVGYHCAIGRYMHWVKRGLLCATTSETCDCRLKPYPRRWYAYLVGWDAKDRRRAVLQIPWQSWRAHRWQHDTTSPNHLIGRRVTATRSTSHPKSPVSLATHSYAVDVIKSPLSPADAAQWLEWAYDHVSPEFESEGELQ